LPFVYLLRCRDGSLYGGAAKDLAARFLAHENGRASKYTRARGPVTLAWSRRVRTWGSALRVEHCLKQLSKREKEALVLGDASAIDARIRRARRKAARIRARGAGR
jgi:putative endonuclease